MFRKICYLSLLISCLIWLVPIGAFGAIHNYGNNTATIDTWFTIRPLQPYFESYYRYIDNNIPDKMLGLEFFQNDQTFTDINIYKQGSVENTYLYGSYLTDVGWFCGFRHSDDSNTVSPGYRWAIDDLSYLAVSIDYLSNDTYKDIKNIELNAKYYNDRMYFFGDVIYYHNPTSYEENIINVGINYQLFETLVIGGQFSRIYGPNRLLVGGTYQTGRLTIDSRITSYISSDTKIEVSGMFQPIDKFKVGADYSKQKELSDGYLQLKAKYQTDRSHFVFKYGFENDIFTSRISLSYQYDF